MKRDEFLKGVGLFGAATLLPGAKALAENGGGSSASKAGVVCTLIPSETEGPFPLDLSTTNSATYFRNDVRETKIGVKLNLKMKIFGTDNCTPMTNVRVNIWHCDKDGSYSGYTTAQGNMSNTTGETWLRGYQMTDAYGEVTFVTIFPGWYSGRVCHIHFQIYVSSVYKAVSQFTFPATDKNALYAANASLYTKGSDPQAIASDNIFSDGYSLQMATLTGPAGDGSYSAYFELAVSGAGNGSTGLANYEGETGGHFKLGQNFPNPHNGFTTIPLVLKTASDVLIDIYDLQARKVATINKGHLNTGEYNIPVDFSALNIPSGNYLYQIQASNSAGVFRQVKMMTEAR